MINSVKYFLVTTLGVAAMYIAKAQTQPDDVVGVWKNGEGTAMVRIYKDDKLNEYRGKIVWLKEPNDPETGQPKLDKNNPKEEKRNSPILGMINVWGFSFKDNEWQGGYIYDPKNGKIYDCVISMKDKSKLNVRGFIMGMTMFGRTDTWVRQVAK
ncbi:MAG TPA: DUF2147 domain-containing protein [Phnomibacter sp.]|nr:DUF2147 domain-containing protein [Phnomibacter sp.]